MEQFTSQRIKKDLFWYLTGAVLPMLVLMLRSPIFTRVFSPEEYGQYTLVFLFFMYLSALKLEWIRASIWRYYVKYKKRQLSRRFWNAVSFFFLASSALIVGASAVWFALADDTLTRQLIAFGALHLITQELVTVILIARRIEGKSAYYNLINGTKTGASFLLLLAMTFLFGAGIPAFFLAPALVNGIVLLFILGKSQFVLVPRFSDIERHDTKRFVNYGVAATVTMGATVLLTSADRWIIHYFWGLEKTGIYNQTYMLGQMSILAIITVLKASFNPYLINNIEKNVLATDTYIAHTFRWFVYIIVPLTVYISLYAREVSLVFLGPAFREAWFLIPFIAFAFLLDGFSHFSAIKLKFTNNLRPLYVGVIIAATINIMMNAILIPRVGFTIAAHTTLFAFLLLFIIYYSAARSTFLHTVKNRLFILIICTILVVQTGMHFLIRPVWSGLHPLLAAGIECSVFALSYVVLTYRISPLREGETMHKQTE